MQLLISYERENHVETAREFALLLDLILRSVDVGRLRKMYKNYLFLVLVWQLPGTFTGVVN
jgi:hypothetical protein